MDILYLIRGRRDRLRGNPAKVAEAILDDVEFAASASIDQLAAKAGVSKAAMSRFARLMDCGDLRELRLRLARASAVGARFLDEAPAAKPPEFFSRMVGDIEQSLHRHLAAFDEARFGTAVDLIVSAGKIHIFGMGGCSTLLAAEMQYRLVRLGYQATACHDPVLMRMAAATLGPQDLLIVLSLSGLPPELLACTRLARAYGARLLAITRAGSPLAAMADTLLPIVLAETDFIYKPTAARYGMLLAIDLLATETALRNPETSQELLRRVKLALDDLRQGEDWLPLGD
ncbi:MurR/RpiR family transcriptional regulator [Pseudomonas sp. Q1-7]|uniref:MurR/RpiR family transcriptional regulator n=1 Tax=Pseudomonas sp. Q1-7 TaxID=3020843 RepID=UPI00230033D4|nr:MurR/RpiR family transcriptional regulator [Pseudomonas sp. Q1-7]